MMYHEWLVIEVELRREGLSDSSLGNQSVGWRHSHTVRGETHCLVLLDAKDRPKCCSTRFRVCPRLSPRVPSFLFGTLKLSYTFPTLLVYFLRNFLFERQ